MTSEASQGGTDVGVGAETIPRKVWKFVIYMTITLYFITTI